MPRPCFNWWCPWKSNKLETKEDNSPISNNNLPKIYRKIFFHKKFLELFWSFNFSVKIYRFLTCMSIEKNDITRKLDSRITVSTNDFQNFFMETFQCLRIFPQKDDSQKLMVQSISRWFHLRTINSFSHLIIL